MSREQKIMQAYRDARERYAELGVNTTEALGTLDNLSISIHCWQADDVVGFENPTGKLTGGIQATGNYPGRARNIEELRQDIEMVQKLVPGSHRLSLHAIYGDYSSGHLDRNQIEPANFASWVDWAKSQYMKIDFNSTFFSHIKSNDGFTLSHPEKGVRDFWKEHLQRCRTISEYIGQELKSTCIHNIWIPDGAKDKTVLRYKYRELLCESLDEVFERKMNPNYTRESLESKLFGIGSECFVVGSHEFYMGYAAKNNMMITLDAGHFHPTEVISDKISSLLHFVPEINLHVSRPERWDSDHVVILSDELVSIAQEIVRSRAMDRIHIGLDYFDASINRIGAYVTGIRAMQKAMLISLLEPTQMLAKYELANNNFIRMAYLEELKSMPWGDVFNYYCMTREVPFDDTYIDLINEYEKTVTIKR